MIPSQRLTGLDEAALARLAELVAFAVRAGDLIALSGDLGAGKTTFARAFIAAMNHPNAVEVPSPTFTLVQTYATPRLAIAHLDLYRLSDPGELGELGLDELVATGAALVEWPERGEGHLRGTRLDLHLTEAASGTGARDVSVRAHGTWAARFARLMAIGDFLSQSGYGGHQVSYLQGDASVRRYARLALAGTGQTVLMDWPPQPDGPPIRDGLPYSRIAQLAEGVRPFVAIAGALDAAGLSAPRVLAQDLERGLLVIEDFGDRVFGVEMRQSEAAQAELWRAGVDTLVALRAQSPPAEIAVADGTLVRLPVYGRGALGIETELLLDWYWPAVHASPAPESVRADYLRIWLAIFERLETLPVGWALRDFHSPNLLWLPDRPAPRNVGLIDFQDAQIGPHAYDLVSLLQDARVDVAPALEDELLARYCAAVTQGGAAFDEALFRWSFAALGAQRNCKILGIFARLAHRDGKPQYLAHIPRIWRYLSRDLCHPGLADLSAWFDEAFPAVVRSRPVAATPAMAVRRG